jgi:hypothetical protein
VAGESTGFPLRKVILTLRALAAAAAAALLAIGALPD